MTATGTMSVHKDFLCTFSFYGITVYYLQACSKSSLSAFLYNSTQAAPPKETEEKISFTATTVEFNQNSILYASKVKTLAEISVCRQTAVHQCQAAEWDQDGGNAEQTEITLCHLGVREQPVSNTSSARGDIRKQGC